MKKTALPSRASERIRLRGLHGLGNCGDAKGGADSLRGFCRPGELLGRVAIILACVVAVVLLASIGGGR